MLYHQKNTFKAKKDQFYDGSRRMRNVIAEESQEKVPREFHNANIELLKNQTANDDARVRNLASTERGKVHANFVNMVDECAQWGMDATTARRDLIEQCDKPPTQIVVSLRPIDNNGEIQ